MQERAARVARDVVSRAPSGSVRAVFAGGSVGRGEVWSLARGSTLEIFSDLDLYVVLSDNADPGAVRRAAADAVASLPLAEDGVVFDRGVDAGVYSLDDLLAQPVRPGTVDLAEHHVWLHGDRSIVDPLRAALRGPMSTEEALYLLENRAWDARDASASGGALAIATSAKVVLDVLAAALVAEGRFLPTYAARGAALRERAPACLAVADLAAIANAEAVRVGDHARGVDPALVRAMVAKAWLALAPSILATAADATPAQLVARRCSQGARARNFREFLRLGRRAGMSLATAAASGLALTTLSPSVALRMHALVTTLVETQMASRESLAFHARYVAALASRLGARGESSEERVRDARRVVS